MQYKVYGTTQKRILQRNVNTECYQYMEITTEKKVTGKKKQRIMLILYVDILVSISLGSIRKIQSWAVSCFYIPSLPHPPKKNKSLDQVIGKVPGFAPKLYLTVPVHLLSCGFGFGWHSFYSYLFLKESWHQVRESPSQCLQQNTIIKCSKPQQWASLASSWDRRWIFS